MKGKSVELPRLYEATTLFSAATLRGFRHERHAYEEAKNTDELIGQYKRALHWIQQAAEDGNATIVLERVDDPATTWTLSGETSVVVGTPNSCWRIRSSSVDGLWLPTLTHEAMKELYEEQKANAMDKRRDEELDRRRQQRKHR